MQLPKKLNASQWFHPKERIGCRKFNAHASVSLPCENPNNVISYQSYQCTDNASHRAKREYGPRVFLSRFGFCLHACAFIISQCCRSPDLGYSFLVLFYSFIHRKYGVTKINSITNINLLIRTMERLAFTLWGTDTAKVCQFFISTNHAQYIFYC